MEYIAICFARWCNPPNLPTIYSPIFLFRRDFVIGLLQFSLVVTQRKLSALLFDLSPSIWSTHGLLSGLGMKAAATNINRFTNTIAQYYNIIPVLIGNGFNYLCIITHVSVITYFIIWEIVYYFSTFHIIN